MACTGCVKETRAELDSHADMCCVGRHAHILHEYSGRKVTVTPFHQELGKMNGVSVVSALVAYDDPSSGAPILLVINQALFFPELGVHLLCPMQLRHNGITVNDCPRHCKGDPKEEDHTLLVGDNGLRISLDLHGVTSYFPVRKPTNDEVELYEKEGGYELTAADPEWEPKSERFAQMEAATYNPDGTTRRRKSDSEKELDVGGVQVGRIPCGNLTETELTYPVDTVGDTVNVSVVATRSEKEHHIRALSQAWGIGLPAARRTVLSTTQRAIRTWGSRNVERRYPSGDRNLRYRRLPYPLFTDTFFATTKSRTGKTCAQIFASDFGWSRVYPMNTKSEAHMALDELFHRVGVPERLIPDDAKELTQGEFRKKAQKAGCPLDPVDPHSPWQNRAENEIREVKRLAKRWAWKTDSPRKLWDYTVKLAALIRSHTAHDMWQLKGEVPETLILGNTADISYLAEFGWYDWVVYNETDKRKSGYPDIPPTIGRYLGPTEPGVGSTMSYYVLNRKGAVVRRTQLRQLTKEEMNWDSIKRTQASFDAEIRKILGPGAQESDKTSTEGEEAIPAPPPAPAESKPVPTKQGRGRPRKVTVSPLSMTAEGDDIDDADWDTPSYDLYEDDQQSQKHLQEEHDEETYDAYVSAKVQLPRGDEYVMGTVTRRKRDRDGNLIGKGDKNPILDTRLYEVEFDDGEVLEYSANIIAENLYSQVDEEGRHVLLMDSILDHRSTHKAVKSENEYFATRSGRRVRRKSTAGWFLCVQWKDHSTSWEPLAALKESNPIEVAEYAVASGIQDEPAFSWWVPFTLRRRERIISAINSRYHKRTHKFGIELPKTVREALEIDKRTGTNFWEEALKKEMRQVSVAFNIIEDHGHVPVGYKEIKCHVVFDIKMGTLQRKARYVAGGHKTDPPKAQTYSSVVSRESVRIALTLAALNGLNVMTGDLENAYLQAKCDEKIWTTLGPEFGPERQGKKAVIVRALYGLKSAGASFRNTLADCLTHLGFQSCKADPDVWLRKSEDKNGFQCYEYLLCYVDDIMAICFHPRDALMKINKYFKFKPGSLAPPNLYLGSKIRPTMTSEGTTCWGQSSSGYVQEAVKNVGTWAEEHGLRLPTRCDTPMSTTYYPELDVTPLLKPEVQNFYQSAIGALRWAIELGRIDIITETSRLASFSTMPRAGHLYAALRIFAYLKRKHNGRLIFDPTRPKVDGSKFVRHDWSNFYGNVKEAIPENAPDPLGNAVTLTGYVDADHAGDRMSRRSRTGYLIFMQSALIQFLSKKQGSVEGATFGSEFMAAKAFAEANRGLRYKLRMMGVPLDGPTYVYADNMSVLHNTTTPESTLKKKSNAIAYHLVREAVAMDEMIMGYIRSDENLADILTKVLPGGERRSDLIRSIVSDVED